VITFVVVVEKSVDNPGDAFSSIDSERSDTVMPGRAHVGIAVACHEGATLVESVGEFG